MNMIVRFLAVLVIAFAFAGCVGYVSPYDGSYYDSSYSSNYSSGYYYVTPYDSYSNGHHYRHYWR
jgi:hypothetical protein